MQHPAMCELVPPFVFSARDGEGERWPLCGGGGGSGGGVLLLLVVVGKWCFKLMVMRITGMESFA